MGEVSILQDHHGVPDVLVPGTRYQLCQGLHIKCSGLVSPVSVSLVVLLPPPPPPLSLCRAGFGGGYPVNPSLGPSITPEIGPVPVASTGNYSPLPSSDVCRPYLTVPRLPGMAGKPYPQFYGSFLAGPPGQRALSVCQAQSGATPYQ